MDISYADDEEPNEEVRHSNSIQNTSATDTATRESIGSKATGRASSSVASPGQNYNPTEAILATLQLIPMPCSKAGRLVMCREEIERNVSVIRSFAQAPSGVAMTTSASTSSGLLLRRKSKSQTGLSDLQGKTSPNTSVICDLDELRSIQRQLQNFPSLDELRRHPLQNMGPPTQPLSSSSANDSKEPASPPACDSSRAHRTRSTKTRSIEDYASAILKILKASSFLFPPFIRPDRE